MQSFSRHGARAAVGDLIPTFTAPRLTTSSQWICSSCRFKVQPPAPLPRTSWRAQSRGTRCLSTTSRLAQEARQSSNNVNPTAPTQGSDLPELPSTAARSRSDFSNRLANIADSILARASIAGQHINVYTGTDYSGIQSLRENIIAQEGHVKSAYDEVEVAKEAHHEEYAKQAGAQKEIVGLLERKANWSPTDLERYMSLVRSEHVNDQAVQNAKRTLDVSERQLEDARQLLERLERKQYHEEQVWSDTIRRNSTWVTFGLMGVNILLLLGQILLFEPMRRKRIVRDLRQALDEKTVHTLPIASASSTSGPAPDGATQEIVEQQVDSVLDPAGVSIDELETNVQQPQYDQSSIGLNPELTDRVDLPGFLGQQASFSDALGTFWYHYRRQVLDLFSDRTIQLKQAELTNVALQGIAAGAMGGVAIMAGFFVFLRH
nr:sensitive to high expression protein 9 like, mitochondrial [Quercus suber]